MPQQPVGKVTIRKKRPVRVFNKEFVAIIVEIIDGFGIIPVFVDPLADKILHHIGIDLGNIADVAFGSLDHLLHILSEREFGLLIPVAFV